MGELTINIHTENKPLRFDFIEYVRDDKTFADRECEKWLAERDAKQKADERGTREKLWRN